MVGAGALSERGEAEGQGLVQPEAETDSKGPNSSLPASGHGTGVGLVQQKDTVELGGRMRDNMQKLKKGA